ncbi:hypothetical protein ARTHRO8AJ_340006 [Arthrobacter sp. 8AJ]|nr:hypothetical protein ARTHRO8AJ_340006 [Arthrobacter sp. 8AJ]
MPSRTGAACRLPGGASGCRRPCPLVLWAAPPAAPPLDPDAPDDVISIPDMLFEHIFEYKGCWRSGHRWRPL